MLPMIMAAAEHEMLLGPDDLRAHLKARLFQASLEPSRCEGPVPDVGYRALE